jgi:DNA-binding MarR family transcriptional regulator/flavin reductase (DIM6/NTAB) family NADH-FMN oxidoreductase RutF
VTKLEPVADLPVAAFAPPADRVRVTARVFSHLASARSAIRGEVCERIRAHGLRTDTCAILLVIANADGPCGNADVADALALPRGSTHRLLKHLQESALVDSVVNPVDRRFNNWLLAPPGAALLTELGLFATPDSMLATWVSSDPGRAHELIEDLITLVTEMAATKQGARLQQRVMDTIEATGQDVGTERAAALRLYLLEMIAYRILRAEATNHLQAATAGAVTLVHYMALCRTVDTCSASEMAEFLRVDPATSIRVVDHLVKFGYVARNRNPSDGRQVVIGTTPAGVELLQTLPPYRDTGRLVDVLMALPERAHRLEENVKALDEAVAGHRDFPIPDMNIVVERFAASVQQAATTPPDQEGYRGALTQLVGGVALMTASNGRVRRALTVSVSAPRTSSLITLTVPSEAAAPLLELVEATGTFGLNVLASTHAPLAATFDRPKRLQKLDASEWFLIDGIPALRTALVTILCSVDRILDAGDHHVVLGVPLHASFGAAPAEPLVAWNGRYHSAASMTGSGPA